MLFNSPSNDIGVLGTRLWTTLRIKYQHVLAYCSKVVGPWTDSFLDLVPTYLDCAFMHDSSQAKVDRAVWWFNACSSVPLKSRWYILGRYS
jgi:hypothetical protein